MPASSFPSFFPAARLHLHGSVERRIDFPDFAGSALRGAFGHALRRAACVTGQRECKPCPLYRRCAYPAIFETPPPPDIRRNYANVAPPYVIEPPAPGPLVREPGQPFQFSLILIGPAIDQFPLIARSFQQALTDIGRGQVRLLGITAESGEPLADFTAGSPIRTPAGSQVTTPAAPENLETATLQFSTPFLLARNGQAIRPSDLTARDILMAIVRRVDELSQIQLRQPLDVDFRALAQLANEANVEIDFRNVQFTRHSARQQRSMPMHGSLGSARLYGNLTPFWPFLHLGQWLHVGKKCVFGFGRYTLHI